MLICMNAYRFNLLYHTCIYTSLDSHVCERSLNYPRAYKHTCIYMFIHTHIYLSFPLVCVKGAPDSEAFFAAQLKFDRVLADVPCTGDGTCRKNIAAFKDWSIKQVGSGEHASLCVCDVHVYVYVKVCVTCVCRVCV
jgi:hypothetical protein